jgi:hypothetical protein
MGATSSTYEVRNILDVCVSKNSLALSFAQGRIDLKIFISLNIIAGLLIFGARYSTAICFECIFNPFYIVYDIISI